MLNCKLRVVVLSVGECNHMGLKGFRGLESVTGDAGVTRGPGGLKEITGVTTGYRGLQKTAKLAFFPKGKSMVLVKDLRCCQFLFLYKILREKLFGYIFVKQQAFLDNGNMDLRKKQNSHFSKGVRL